MTLRGTPWSKFCTSRVIIEPSASPLTTITADDVASDKSVEVRLLGTADGGQTGTSTSATHASGAFIDAEQRPAR